MNKEDINLLNLCLEDSLFAALYDTLCLNAKKWGTFSPVDIWLRALSARKTLSESRRPDLLLHNLFCEYKEEDEVSIEFVLFFMLINEDRNNTKTLLKDELALMIMSHGEIYEELHKAFRNSEDRNERKGFYVCQTDYSNYEVPTEMYEQNIDLAHKMVSCALESNDTNLCRALYYILSHIDYQNGHIYENEVKRLAEQTANIGKRITQINIAEQNNNNCQQFMGNMENTKFTTPQQYETI